MTSAGKPVTLTSDSLAQNIARLARKAQGERTK